MWQDFVAACAGQAKRREKYQQAKLFALAQERAAQQQQADAWVAAALPRHEDICPFMARNGIQVLAYEVRRNDEEEGQATHRELARLKCKKGNWLFTLRICRTYNSFTTSATLLCGGLCNSVTGETVRHDHTDVYSQCDLLARYTPAFLVDKTLALLASRDLAQFCAEHWSYLFELEPALRDLGFSVFTTLRTSDIRMFAFPEIIQFMLERDEHVFYLLSDPKAPWVVSCSSQNTDCQGYRPWRSHADTPRIIELVQRFHQEHAREETKSTRDEVAFARGAYGVFDGQRWLNDRTMVAWLEGLQQQLLFQFPQHQRADEARLDVDLGSRCPTANVHEAKFYVVIEFGGLPSAHLLLDRARTSDPREKALADLAVCGFDFGQLDASLSARLRWTMNLAHATRQGGQFSLSVMGSFFDEDKRAHLLSEHTVCVGTYAQVQAATRAFLTELYHAHQMPVAWKT